MEKYHNVSKACDDAGKDFTDPEVLAAALCETNFSDFQGTHTFRDFDHVLTYDAYYVTGVDGGEKFNGRPIGGSTVRYSPEEWLPAYEDMVIYAKKSASSLPIRHAWRMPVLR